MYNLRALRPIASKCQHSLLTFLEVLPSSVFLFVCWVVTFSFDSPLSNATSPSLYYKTIAYVCICTYKHKGMTITNFCKKKKKVHYLKPWQVTKKNEIAAHCSTGYRCCALENNLINFKFQQIIMDTLKKNKKNTKKHKLSIIKVSNKHWMGCNKCKSLKVCVLWFLEKFKNPIQFFLISLTKYSLSISLFEKFLNFLSTFSQIHCFNRNLWGNFIK